MHLHVYSHIKFAALKYICVYFNALIMDKDTQDLLSSKISHDDKDTILLSYLNSTPMQKIPQIMSEVSTVWTDLSLSRLTKLIKKLLSALPSNEDHLNLVNSLIDLYANKKLLALDLQAHRIELLLFKQDYTTALASISSLAKEVKKHDDKINLIRLMVCESRAYMALKNVPRAKSALISARALAVSTFCPSILQANIDLLSGMHLCDEKNAETAYAYFIESFDGYVLEKSVECMIVARYLILCKIIGGKYSDIQPLVTRLNDKAGHLADITHDKVIELLNEISKYCLERNLIGYSELLSKELIEDEFIGVRLHQLYDRLLETNIIKIIEPYRNVKIEFICDRLMLDKDIVEGRLRKMILDGKICGILDHIGRCLLLFDKVSNNSYKTDIVDKLIEFVSTMKPI